MVVRVDFLIEEHIGIPGLLILSASETLIFEVVLDVELRDAFVVEFKPLLTYLDVGVVVTGLSGT
jgi:hypothetical protein